MEKPRYQLHRKFFRSGNFAIKGENKEHDDRNIDEEVGGKDPDHGENFAHFALLAIKRLMR
jgi:hypothetical protein